MAWRPTTIVGVVGALATVVASAATWALAETEWSEERADLRRNYERQCREPLVCPEVTPEREFVEVLVPVEVEGRARCVPTMGDAQLGGSVTIFASDASSF